MTAAFVVALTVVLVAALGQGGADLIRAEAQDAKQPVTRTAGVDPVGFGLKTVTYNMCGGGQCNKGLTTHMPEIAKHIDLWRPHLLMLQEVCWSQYQWFRTKYQGTYNFGFTPLLTDYRNGCGASDCTVNQDADPANDDTRCLYGQVFAARGTLGPPDVIPLGGERHQVSQDQPGATLEQTNPKRKFNALCYDVELTDLPTRDVKGCSVHLRAFHDDEQVNQRARTAQAARLASELDGDIAAEKIVVVGGDFNSWPDQGNSEPDKTTPAMDAFYRPDARPKGGWGVFYEADQGDKTAWTYVEPHCSAANCRAGERTVSSREFVYGDEPVGKGTKYDYLFYSETNNRDTLSGDSYYLFVRNPDGSVVTRADGTAVRVSEHTFYRGVAYITP